MDPFSQPPLDLLSEWFVMNGLSRSLVDPVIRLNLGSLGSTSTESSDRFPQGRGRMSGDEAVLIIHLPRAIQELSDFHASFGIGSSNLVRCLPQRYLPSFHQAHHPNPLQLSLTQCDLVPFHRGHFNSTVNGDISTLLTQEAIFPLTPYSYKSIF